MVAKKKNGLVKKRGLVLVVKIQSPERVVLWWLLKCGVVKKMVRK